MKSNRFLLTLLSLALSAAAASPGLAKGDLPEVNDEGMALVRNSELATVYADPGADLGVYSRIWLQDASVAFKKNWQRDQNRSDPFKVRTDDMLRIQEDVATLFREVFTEKLTEAGYQLAEDAADDVLMLKPAIVDLDVVAPDIPSSGRITTFSESAGEMTLNLEMYDSLTGDKIAKATDRKRDFRKGYLEWRTNVSNRADARRMMTAWAKALVATLDEARSSTGQDD